MGVACIALACQGPRLPDAEVTGVTPSRVWRGADVPITIDGTNFLPGIEVDARGYGADLDTAWEAYLVGQGRRLALLGESLESQSRIRALVPAGFEPGLYTLELVSPGGDDVVSDITVEVTESQEAAFAVTYFDDPGAYVAGQQVRFLIEAVGLDSERVYTDVPVAVSLNGAATGLSSTVAFDDVEVLPGGNAFTGVLPDGGAVLVVDLLSPGRLDVLAASPPGAPDLQPGSLTLVVGGGDELPATIDVPPAVLNEGVRAGDPFDVTVTVFDELGDVVQEPIALTLGNACGDFESDVVARGPTVVSVEVYRATVANTGCEADQIVVVRGAEGASEAFEVRGGDATRFGLLTLGYEFRAGEPDIVVLVRPEDAWQNLTTWSGELTVADDLGSLTDTVCQPGPQVLTCFGTPTIAGEDIEVTVTGDDGLSGSLSGYRILPSDIAADLRLQVPGSVRAGLFADVSVEVLDPWGNVQLPEQVDPYELALVSEQGDAVCTLGGVGPTGAVDFSCTFTAARTNGRLRVQGSGSLAGLSATERLVIDNGFLAEVEVSAPSAVQAGQGFSLGLVGRDAFANPYVLQDDPVVSLVEGSGTLSTDQALLGPDGTATVAVSLTRSGTWTVEASQGGVLLGTSDPIAVSPAPTDGLRLDVAGPWGEVGVPTEVLVESVDPFGNRTALSESLTVSSKLTATAPEALALINGVATVSWTWIERAVDETLEADSASGFSGSSVPLYVVDDCGVSGPSIDLLLGGARVGLVCFDDLAGSGTVTADLSASVPGSNALIGYGVAASGPDEVAVVGSADVFDVELPAVGAYEVRAIAVDAVGCAAEWTTEAYVGADDGTPTGPVTLVPDAATIDVAATTTVDILGATDCAGDPAGGAELLVRAAAGVVAGATATGEGLAVTLDAVGDGTFDVTTEADVADNGPTAGELVMAAGTTDGSARGRATVLVTGDAVRPTVVDQQPAGLTTGFVDTVTLTFSEDLLPSSAVPSRFALTGPGSATVTDAQVDGETVTLTVSPAVDADAGAWLLTVSDDVRDLAGNRLSGDWSGDRAVYVGAFGDAGAVPDPVSCPAVDPPGAFRPDGDDGPGVEADQVTVTLSSLTAPAWWVAEVEDATGSRVVQRWAVPAGASDVWSWDGRDAAGFVVPAGTYTLSIRPDDGFGNRGTGCVVQTVVEHPFEEP